MVSLWDYGLWVIEIHKTLVDEWHQNIFSAWELGHRIQSGHNLWVLRVISNLGCGTSGRPKCGDSNMFDNTMIIKSYVQMGSRSSVSNKVAKGLQEHVGEKGVL